MVKINPLEGFAFNDEYDLETLIAQQGVSPIVDLDELASLWPANDDPDAFWSFISSERRHRRSLA